MKLNNIIFALAVVLILVAACAVPAPESSAQAPAAINGEVVYVGQGFRRLVDHDYGVICYGYGDGLECFALD